MRDDSIPLIGCIQHDCAECQARTQQPDRLERDLHQAEYEAWKNLARYKFWMFGYFAGRWVYLNRVIGKPALPSQGTSS